MDKNYDTKQVFNNTLTILLNLSENIGVFYLHNQLDKGLIILYNKEFNLWQISQMQGRGIDSQRKIMCTISLKAFSQAA